MYIYIYIHVYIYIDLPTSYQPELTRLVQSHRFGAQKSRALITESSCDLEMMRHGCSSVHVRDRTSV